MITTNHILFIFLLIIPASFYTLASFYNLVYPNNSIVTAFFIAMIFVSLEYMFKIPIIKFGSDNGLNPWSIQICWIILTLLLSFIISSATKHKIQLE